MLWSKQQSFKFISTSKESKIHFPLNKATFKYETENFRPYMTNNKLSTIELDGFFTEIYAASNNFNNLRNRCPLMLVTLICLFTVSSIFSYVGSHFEFPNETLLFHAIFHPSFITTNIAVLLVLGLVILKIKHNNYIKTRIIVETIIKSKENYFDSKGLKWLLPEDSLNFITLLNEDVILDSSFESDYEPDVKTDMQPTLRMSLLDNL